MPRLRMLTDIHNFPVHQHHKLHDDFLTPVLQTGQAFFLQLTDNCNALSTGFILVNKYLLTNSTTFCKPATWHEEP